MAGFRLRRVFILVASVLAVLVVAAGGWAAYAPLPPRSREVVYEIPKGHASRLGGGYASTLPSRVRLTVGYRDVLVLRNEDEVPASFGPVVLAPGQRYRVPFTTPGEIPFACSVHPDGQITLTVVPMPEAGWARLSWRIAEAVGL
jgi:hypothetical protein